MSCPILYPPAKDVFKTHVKSKVIDFWEVKLKGEASLLPSLIYFNPNFMSLATTHKIWTTAGNKPYEVSKARIQLLVLGSHYPCAQYSRHWTPENPLGLCSFPMCMDHKLVESPEHILIHCPVYIATRQYLVSLCSNTSDPVSQFLMPKIMFSNMMMQFLLDCSALPLVIHFAQLFGDTLYKNLFYLSRTWCFSLHRERIKRLNKGNFT